MAEFASRFRRAPIWLGLLGNPGLLLLLVAISKPNFSQLSGMTGFAVLSVALNGIGLVAAIIIRLKVKPPTDADKLGLVINCLSAVMWLALVALALYFGPKGRVVL